MNVTLANFSLKEKRAKLGKISLAGLANEFASTEFSVALCRLGGQVSQVAKPSELYSFFSTGHFGKEAQQVHRIYTPQRPPLSEPLYVLKAQWAAAQARDLTDVLHGTPCTV